MNCNNSRNSFLNSLFVFWCFSLTGQNVQDTVAGIPGFAQLPPVFGPEYDEIAQKDELTRVFISPVKVMWTSDNTGELVTNTEVLLQPGNSQSDMSPITQFCSIKSTESDTSSILLDYGKKLHGGLQLVMGGTSRREPSLVCIRFGESVEEANSDTCNSDWLMGS